jgi:hypothetical protein
MKLDRYLKECGFGGRYPHETLPANPETDLYETILAGPEEFVVGRREEDPQRFKDFPGIVTGIAESGDINAIAIRDPDTYYIAVCRGVIDKLIDIFPRLLSRPDVFPWLVDGPIDVPGVDTGALPPIRLTRRVLAALWMANAATHFLMYHEVGHVVCGHLDYGSGARNARFIMEAVSSGGRPHENLERQSLEYEADAFAAVLLLSYHFHPNRLSVDLPFLVGCDNKDKPIRVLNLLLGSILGVLRMFGGTLKDYDKWDEDTHPPAEVRRISIVSHAVAHLHEWKRTELLDRQGTFHDAAKAVDIALREILGQGPLSEEWAKEFELGGKFTEHAVKLNRLLADQLKPQLNKCAYVPTT